MKLQLEFYQRTIMFTYFGFLIFIAAMLFQNNYLLLASLVTVIPGCLLGALLALTNIHKKEIVLKWKKVKTELRIPFMRNTTSFTACDNEGNTFKLNFLLIPKKIENK